MRKLKGLSYSELRERLENRKTTLQQEYKWLHTDKLYVGLINELNKRR